MRKELLNRLKCNFQITEFEQKLLSWVWRQYLQSREWPKCCNTHIAFEEADRNMVREAFIKLGGTIIQEVKYSHDECAYHLTALGCVFAAETDVVNSSVQILNIFQDRAYSGNFDGELKKSEIQEIASLSEIELREFFRFFNAFIPIRGGGSGDIDSWSLSYNQEIDKLLSEDDLLQYLINSCFNIDTRTPFESDKREEFEKHILFAPKRLVAAYHYVIQRIIQKIVYGTIIILGIISLLFVLELWVPGFHLFGLSPSFSATAKWIITVICVVSGFGIKQVLRKICKPLIRRIYRIFHERVFRLALSLRWEYYYRIDEILKDEWDSFTENKSI